MTTPEKPPTPETPPIEPTPPTPTPPTVVTHPGHFDLKDPGTQSIAQGGTAVFSITVRNTGDVALINVNVSDPLSANCTRAIGMLAPGASLTYTCTLANVRVNFENVATVTATPPTGADVSASDSALVSVTEPFTPPVVIVNHPSILITKNPKAQTVAKGGTAVFTITVKNNGDVDLTDVTVSDPRSPACNRTIGTLAAGAAVTYTCTLRNVKASFDNVAVAKGNAGATAVSATDTAPVKVANLSPRRSPS